MVHSSDQEEDGRTFNTVPPSINHKAVTNSVACRERRYTHVSVQIILAQENHRRVIKHLCQGNGSREYLRSLGQRYVAPIPFLRARGYYDENLILMPLGAHFTKLQFLKFNRKHGQRMPYIQSEDSINVWKTYSLGKSLFFAFLYQTIKIRNGVSLLSQIPVSVESTV